MARDTSNELSPIGQFSEEQGSTYQGYSSPDSGIHQADDQSGDNSLIIEKIEEGTLKVDSKISEAELDLNTRGVCLIPELTPNQSSTEQIVHEETSLSLDSGVAQLLDQIEKNYIEKTKDISNSNMEKIETELIVNDPEVIWPGLTFQQSSNENVLIHQEYSPPDLKAYQVGEQNESNANKRNVDVDPCKREVMLAMLGVNVDFLRLNSSLEGNSFNQTLSSPDSAVDQQEDPGNFPNLLLTSVNSHANLFPSGSNTNFSTVQQPLFDEDQLFQNPRVYQTEDINDIFNNPTENIDVMLANNAENVQVICDELLSQPDSKVRVEKIIETVDNAGCRFTGLGDEETRSILPYSTDVTSNINKIGPPVKFLTRNDSLKMNDDFDNEEMVEYGLEWESERNCEYDDQPPRYAQNDQAAVQKTLNLQAMNRTSTTKNKPGKFFATSSCKNSKGKMTNDLRSQRSLRSSLCSEALQFDSSKIANNINGIKVQRNGIENEDSKIKGRDDSFKGLKRRRSQRNRHASKIPRLDCSAAAIVEQTKMPSTAILKTCRKSLAKKKRDKNRNRKRVNEPSEISLEDIGIYLHGKNEDKNVKEIITIEFSDSEKSSQESDEESDDENSQGPTRNVFSEDPLKESSDGSYQGPNKTCSCCNKTFSRLQNLRRHQESLKTKNVPEMRKFACKHCSKKFSRKEAATLHEKTIHESSVKYDCDHCGRPFSQLCGKKRHEKLFPNEGCIKMPFECQLCPYRVQFKFRDSLLRHIRTIHKNSELQQNFIREDLPFSCKRCGKKFSKLKSQQEHELKKNSCDTVRILPCKHCDKTFTKKKRLTIHERQHTKPYSCKKCEQRLSSMSNLRCHEEICGKQHGIQNSKTCKCGKKFGKFCWLDRHLSYYKEKETREKHLKVVYSDGIDEILDIRKKNVTGGSDEDLKYQKTCFAAISPN